MFKTNIVEIIEEIVDFGREVSAKVSYKGIQQQVHGKVVDIFSFRNRMHVRVQAQTKQYNANEEIIYDFVFNNSEKTNQIQFRQSSWLQGNDDYIPIILRSKK